MAFTTDLEPEPYDLVLNTRLFLYRKALRPLIAEATYFRTSRSC